MEAENDATGSTPGEVTRGGEAMDERRPAITVVPGLLAICRLDPADSLPAWALDGPFWCVCRTADELSVVCPQERVPRGTRAEVDWRGLRLEGPLPLTMTGMLSSVLAPLADAEVSIFALSTFDTDYVLIREQDLAAAAEALRAAGHEVRG
jgi:hypothetical protein